MKQEQLNKKAVMQQLIVFVVGLVAVTFVSSFGGTLLEKLNETQTAGGVGQNISTRGANAIRDTSGYYGLITLGYIGVLLLGLILGGYVGRRFGG